MSDNKINHENHGTDSKKNRAKVQERKLVRRVNTLDEGVIAFGEWLISRDNIEAACGPLTLMKFVDNAQVQIFDKELGKEVHVEVTDGIPECKTCTDSECIHIGFSICISQMHRRNGMVNLT